MEGMDHSMTGMEGGSQAATPPVSAPVKAPDANASEDTYTCVMHPQIAEPKPDKCPICGMPLVKKAKQKK